MQVTSKIRSWCWLIAALVGIAAGFGAAQPVAAAGVVGDGTPASCDGNALAAALVGGGLVTFDCGPNAHTIHVNTNVIEQPTVVAGNGLVTLSGEDLRQIFLVSAGASLTLTDMTLIDGNFGDGGAIYIASGAEVLIQRSFLISNEAEAGGHGGAIYNAGTLRIELSSLGSNIAGGDGGAIYNAGGEVTVLDTTLISNQAANGGGILNNNGTVHLTRVAVRSNIAQNFGGGIYHLGNTLAVTNTTFYDNRAERGGGFHAAAGVATQLLNVTFNRNRSDTGSGIWSDDGAVRLRNTIVANGRNTADGDSALNCDGPSLQSDGHNLISDNSCILAGSGANDQAATDPLLEEFINDNGSPTRNFMPLPGSPAIDQGDAAACPATDQRGALRPAGAGCDIGAVEADGLFPALYLALVLHD